MRLLLVEDDVTTVESIILCMEIYQPDSIIVPTRKGNEALELLKNQEFDAVLIDLGLPDVDGAEVIQKMRQFTHIPAVVLTARYSPELVGRVLELGADDYITKPFDFRNLLGRLKKVIDKAQPRTNPAQS